MRAALVGLALLAAVRVVLPWRRFACRLCGAGATWKGIPGVLALDVHAQPLRLFDGEGRMPDGLALRTSTDAARADLRLAADREQVATLENHLLDDGSRSLRPTASADGVSLWQGVDRPPERAFKDGPARFRSAGGRWVPAGP